jgi:hypothetical protein
MAQSGWYTSAPSRAGLGMRPRPAVRCTERASALEDLEGLVRLRAFLGPWLERAQDPSTGTGSVDVGRHVDPALPLAR